MKHLDVSHNKGTNKLRNAQINEYIEIHVAAGLDSKTCKIVQPISIRIGKEDSVLEYLMNRRGHKKITLLLILVRSL